MENLTPPSNSLHNIGADYAKQLEADVISSPKLPSDLWPNVVQQSSPEEMEKTLITILSLSRYHRHAMPLLFVSMNIRYGKIEGNELCTRFTELNANTVDLCIETQVCIPPEFLRHLTNSLANNPQINFLKLAIPRCFLDSSYGESLAILEKLTTLDISDNNLVQGGIDFVRLLTNLTQLDVSYAKLENDDIKNITPLTKLRYLYLDENELTGAFTEYISNLTNLNVLEMEGSNLSEGGVTCIWLLTNLRLLSISNTGIQTDDLTDITVLTNLTSLYAGENFLTGEALKIIGEVTTIRELNFDYNNLQYETEYVSLLTNLTNLQAVGNVLTSENSHHFTTLTNLTHLDLDGNQFGLAGVTCFINLPALKMLSVKNNNLDDNEKVNLTTQFYSVNSADSEIFV